MSNMKVYLQLNFYEHLLICYCSVGNNRSSTYVYIVRKVGMVFEKVSVEDDGIEETLTVGRVRVGCGANQLVEAGLKLIEIVVGR